MTLQCAAVNATTRMADPNAPPETPCVECGHPKAEHEPTAGLVSLMGGGRGSAGLCNRIDFTPFTELRFDDKGNPINRERPCRCPRFR